MLISILRRPDGLVALTAERVGAIQAPAPSAPLVAVTSYAERIVPFEAATVSFKAICDKAAAQLRSAQDDARSLANVFHLLVNSIADPGTFATSRPRPRLEEAPSAPKRTAANPRAFQGTRFQPPKPAKPQPADFLQWLDGGGNEAALLEELAEHLGPSIDLVEREAEYGSMLRDRRSATLKPLGQCWPPEVRAKLVGLPPEFRRYFLWQLRGSEGPEVSNVISRFWALDLNGPELRRIIAALLAPVRLSPRLQWVALLELVAPARRLTFAELLLDSGAQRYDAPPPAVIERHESLCTDDNYHYRTHCLLAALTQGGSATYLLDGFELANDYKPDAEFDVHGHSETALASVRRAMVVMGDTDAHWQNTGLPLYLWRRCGQLPGFDDLLASLEWGDLGPKTAYELAELVGNTLYSDLEGEELDAKWRCIRRFGGDLERVLADIEPRFRAKALAHLRDVIFEWDHPQELEWRLLAYLDLLPRLCAEPFADDAVAVEAIGALAFNRANDEWKWLFDVPDTHLITIEKACARANDDRLVARGLKSLSALSFAVFQGFWMQPKSLCAAAKALGCLREEARTAVLDGFGTSALHAVLPQRCPLETLFELLSEAPCGVGASLLSKKLKAHYAGGVQLTQAQLDRQHARITADWDRFLLSRIETLVLETLGDGIGSSPATPGERHALLFQASAHEHRRALRNMLKAHFSGDTDYVPDHPLNAAWFRSHPTIDRDLWLRGLVFRHDLPGRGEVTIGIEQDPLEVLRLGTYAGSCLGLGGGHTYSAAAIALDANKQVAYCRDKRGRVVARQLLAISEAEILHCFEVYPYTGPQNVKDLFLEFDREFSAALAIPIHDPEDDGPDEDDIAHLLSKDWWYDSAIRVPDDS